MVNGAILADLNSVTDAMGCAIHKKINIMHFIINLLSSNGLMFGKLVIKIQLNIKYLRWICTI